MQLYSALALSIYTSTRGHGRCSNEYVPFMYIPPPPRQGADAPVLVPHQSVVRHQLGSVHHAGWPRVLRLSVHQFDALDVVRDAFVLVPRELTPVPHALLPCCVGGLRVQFYCAPFNYVL